MSDVPGADPVTGKAMDPGHRKKKKKRGGKKGKIAEPEPEFGGEPDSMSGHEGGSESSQRDNEDGGGVGLGSSPVMVGEGGKITDDSSIDDGEHEVKHEDEDDTLTTIKAEPADMPLDMPISSAQLLDEKNQPEEVPDPKGPIELWLDSHEEHPFKGISQELRKHIIEFLEDHTNSDYDPNHMQEVRCQIWRAVVRSNYWWVNPDTGEWTGRQRPIQVNEGVYSGNFEAFVYCCAERQDRVGRDIATHEYVRKVEDDVREFIFRAEKAGLLLQLEHLAFLLMFDEIKRHPHEVSVAEMQERICVAFVGSAGKMNWNGLNYMKAAGKMPKLNNNQHPGIGETVWKAAMAEL